MRQCGDGCAVHARRNLPDKVFRYLRTVIVTAVVHQCFTQELAHSCLTFWHRTGIALYTSSFGVRRELCF